MSVRENVLEMLEGERDRIVAAIQALQTDGRKRGNGNGKRHMSVEARRRIGLATKKRWALRRKEAAAQAQSKAA